MCLPCPVISPWTYPNNPFFHCLCWLCCLELWGAAFQEKSNIRNNGIFLYLSDQYLSSFVRKGSRYCREGCVCTLFISASTQWLGDSSDPIDKAAWNNDPSLFTAFAACLFWVAFPSAWVVQVITERQEMLPVWDKCGGLSMPGLPPSPKPPAISFFFRLRKKCCFHSTDSFTASPCLEGEDVSCP